LPDRVEVGGGRPRTLPGLELERAREMPQRLLGLAGERLVAHDVEEDCVLAAPAGRLARNGTAWQTVHRRHDHGQSVPCGQRRAGELLDDGSQRLEFAEALVELGAALRRANCRTDTRERRRCRDPDAARPRPRKPCRRGGENGVASSVAEELVAESGAAARAFFDLPEDEKLALQKASGFSAYRRTGRRAANGWRRAWYPRLAASQGDQI
jgi:hypothetical protein